MTEPTNTELIAVVVAVTAGEPRILTIDGTALPSGSFISAHRSLQTSLRAWVEQQTHHPLGYVEQLYTFADRGRTGAHLRTISISYLGLTRESDSAAETEAGWHGWYRYFPWEDHRSGRPCDALLTPALHAWAGATATSGEQAQRWQRAAYTFGLENHAWNEELILQRYELLYEANLVEEADGFRGAPLLGTPMLHDHRRILATGIARLRAKIKYRPVVFEVMPPEFTLSQLQRSVEALAGRTLHKPNFRRLITQQELVEESGGNELDTGGRPARLYRCAAGTGADGNEIAACPRAVGTRQDRRPRSQDRTFPTLARPPLRFRREDTAARPRGP